jgi:hypothetical protein
VHKFEFHLIQRLDGQVHIAPAAFRAVEALCDNVATGAHVLDREGRTSGASVLCKPFVALVDSLLDPGLYERLYQELIHKRRRDIVCHRVDLPDGAMAV